MAHHVLEVARPAAEVFTVVTDPDSQPRWQPSIVEIDRIDRGPVRLGSRVREVRSFLGHRLEVVWEVTAYVPFELAAITVVSGAVRGGASYRLAGVGGRTRLELEVHLEPRGCLRLTSAALRPAAEAELALSCRRLRGLLERRPIAA